MNRRMKKGIGGIIVSLIMITSIAAVIPMAAGTGNTNGDETGTGTPGYWKNHPDAWPVEEITIGGVDYTVTDAIAEMDKPVKRDMTYAMFQALVATRLNVESGSNKTCIMDTIANANIWINNHPLGSGVKAKDHLAWQEEDGGGEELKDMLDDYNNGLLCAPSRDYLEE